MTTRKTLARLVIALIALPALQGCWSTGMGCGIIPPVSGTVAHRSCLRADDHKEWYAEQAKAEGCVRLARNKAVTAATQAKAYGGNPGNYATPTHLDECEVRGSYWRNQ